jgi:recombination protein RecA
MFSWYYALLAPRFVQSPFATLPLIAKIRRIRFAMPTSSASRLQIESALAQKIPSALTPAPKMVRPVAATGIASLDDVLKGGLPVGAVSELVGPECSGRTSVALSFLSRMTQAAKVCAWIESHA